MFKFIKQYTETIHGVEWFGIVSLMIFVIFFSSLLINVFTSEKKYMEDMSEMPLDKSNTQNK